MIILFFAFREIRKCWQIEASSDMMIQLNTRFFRLETDSHCTYDFLLVRGKRVNIDKDNKRKPTFMVF